MTGDAVNRPLILLGAGGHAKVLLGLMQGCRLVVLGVSAPELTREGTRHWRCLDVLGDDDALYSYDPSAVALVNGLGRGPRGDARIAIYQRFVQRGFVFPLLLHTQSIVDPSARLAAGVQVMAGAVLQADCQIGENSIVNTGAGVDHDCVIGSHVHIAPGATLCGGVRVGDRAFIGAGATLLPGRTIGSDAVVCAGGVVRDNLADGARLLEHKAMTAGGQVTP